MTNTASHNNLFSSTARRSSTSSVTGSSAQLTSHPMRRHACQTNTMTLHRTLFQKKTQRRHSQPTIPSNYACAKYSSPTDHMLSPCSKKLNMFKSNIFKMRASKPTKLSFNFNSSASAQAGHAA